MSNRKKVVASLEPSRGLPDLIEKSLVKQFLAHSGINNAKFSSIYKTSPNLFGGQDDKLLKQVKNRLQYLKREKDEQGLLEYAAYLGLIPYDSIKKQFIDSDDNDDEEDSFVEEREQQYSRYKNVSSGKNMFTPPNLKGVARQSSPPEPTASASLFGFGSPERSFSLAAPKERKHIDYIGKCV